MIFIIDTGIGNAINKIDALRLAQEHDPATKIYCTELLKPVFEVAGLKNIYVIQSLERKLIGRDETVVFFYDCLRFKNILVVVGKRIVIQLDDRISIFRKFFYWIGVVLRLFSISVHRIDYYQHERMLNFDLVVREFFKQKISQEELVTLCQKTDFHTRALRKLREITLHPNVKSWGGRAIALQCGVANGKPTIKGFSAERLAKLSDLLVQNGFKVFLFGGKSDVDFANRVVGLCTEKVENLVGNLSLIDSWASLLRAHCTISFDSSIGHMAAFSRCNLVWVGGCTAFTRTRPWSSAHLTRYVLCATHQNYLAHNPIREEAALTKFNGYCPTETVDLSEILDGVRSFPPSKKRIG